MKSQAPCPLFLSEKLASSLEKHAPGRQGTVWIRVLLLVLF